MAESMQNYICTFILKPLEIVCAYPEARID